MPLSPLLPVQQVRERRIGRFSISRFMIDTVGHEMMPAVFSHFLVIRAEYMMHSDGIEYVALSDLFDVVPEGSRVPEYALAIYREESAEGGGKLKLGNVKRL